MKISEPFIIFHVSSTYFQELQNVWCSLVTTHKFFLFSDGIYVRFLRLKKKLKNLVTFGIEQ